MVIKKEKVVKNKKPGLNLTPFCIHFLLGTVWLSLIVTSYVVDPIHWALKQYTKVTNGSFVHDFMTREVEGIHLKAFLFDVTNAKRFEDGEDTQLHVREVGPFTYREIRSNIDVDIDEGNSSMFYTPQIRLEFVPEESVARPEDVNVTMPNIPMLGTASKMADYAYLTKLGFNVMVNQLGSKPFVTLDAFNYLWGYEEPLVSLSHSLMPGSIPFAKMGILDRIYDPQKQTRVEVSIADEDKYTIKSLNGHKKLGMSEDVDPDMCTLCNTFENTYEGVGYRPGIDSSFRIKLYRIGVCRLFDLEYHGTKHMDYGADAMVYHFKDNFFTLDPNETSTGLLPLPECFLGVPLAFSKAHFIDADPSMYERVVGIDPNPERFPAWIAVDPKIGLQLETVISLQLNLVVGDVSFNKQAKSFSNMVVPIVFLQIEQAPMPDESKMFLSGVYHTGPWLLLAARLGFFLLLLISWGYVSRSLYRYYTTKGDKAMSFPLAPSIKEINANNVEEPLMKETQIPQNR